MRYLFAFLLFLFTVHSRAQTGNYFLSHYVPSDERLEHICFDMVQNEQGIIFFATRTGILRFDGLHWDILEGGNGAVYALEANDHGEIFWGGANGFGKLKTETDGTVIVEKLSRPEDRDVYQALSLKDKMYFLNDNAVFTLMPDKSVISLRSDNLSGSFTLLFELYGMPYVNTDASLNYKIDQGKLQRSAFNLPGGTEIIFATRFENHYLVGSQDHLYLCSENLDLREIIIEDKEYINASVIINAAWVNRHLVALGTLRGGIIFINPFTGKTDQIIDYNAGLPDNEVFALMCDKNKNVWAAHDYGFTRISPFLPFRSFSHYDGLQGNILCAKAFNDQVYAGTSLGLFKLVREDVYEDIVYYVDVEVKDPVKQNTIPADAEEPARQNTLAQKEKKKGFLRFLKRRSKEETLAENTPNIPETNSNENSSANKPDVTIKKLKKTEKLLRSSRYVYKKVKGIEAKVTHLAEVDGRLVASGLAGVFEIDGLKATSILEEPARFLFSFRNDLLIISTYADNIHTFKHNQKLWRSIQSIDTIEDEITFIFEGLDELWLCGLNRIYNFKVQEGNLDLQHTFDLPNPNFSKVAGVQWNSDIAISNYEGFFSVDRENSKIIEIDSLPPPKAYFASAFNLWYHNGHNWNVLGEATRQSNIHLLNIFPDLRFIASDVESDNMWVITGNNELYKFFGEKLSLTDTQYPLFVKSVKHGDKKIASDRIKIVQEEGTLIVEIVKPVFTGAGASEYRYFLKGLNDDWSDWSHNHNEMSFPYLPPGKYTLLAQSRDVFGLTTSMSPLDIEVLPPYWKRSWFYAMEFSVFALLVMLSFRLSVRYRLVSRLLSLLTIILLIEFIQTIAGYTFSTNSSPVIDFIIQVLVACVVLPIEGYLRNLMFKSMNSENRLYKIMSGTHRHSKQKSDTLDKL